MEIGHEELARARDPGTPDAELSRLAGFVRAAQRARRPPSLTEIESAVLAAIAGNPNTPPALLFELAMAFTGEVVQNPALVFLPLENPAVVTTIVPYTLELILRHPDVPPDWLALAAQRAEARGNDVAEGRILNLVASSPRTPPEVLVRLSNRPQPHIRIAVAGNPSTPPEVLTRFARTEDEAGPVRESLRRAVASNPRAPVPTLEHLAEDPVLLPVVAGNPSLPAYLFDVLAAHDHPSVRAMVATQARLPARLVRRLAADPSLDVRRALALHAGDPDVLVRFAAGEGAIQRAVAQNPRAPEPLLRRLAAAPAGKVRRAAVRALAARTPGTS